MAALLVAMSVMAIVLSAAMPVWSQMIRRDKEEELIFRGTQYARAINQYQRKFASASPPSLDVLIEQRLLRKKFRDPLSPNKDGEFQLLYLQNQATTGTPGQVRARRDRARLAGRAKAREVPVPEWRSNRRLDRASPSGRGAIVGVASKNTGQSIQDLQRQRPLQRVAVHRDGDIHAGRAGRASRATRRPSAGRPRRARWRRQDREADESGGTSNHNTRRHRSRCRQAGRRAVHPHAQGRLALHRATPDGSAGWPCSRASDSHGS